MKISPGEREPKMAPKEDRYNIRVLDRAFAVISVLQDGKARSLTELSEEIDLNSSTTFRLLATLNYYNYVERNEESGKYKLGLACLELARAYSQTNDVRRAALESLERLRDDTNESIHLGVLNEMEVVYLEKLHGNHAVGLMSSRIGSRLPAHCTGLGKAMLAYKDPVDVKVYYSDPGKLKKYTNTTLHTLDDLMNHLTLVKERGYAFDHSEREPDVSCVAAPVFAMDGSVVAAISVSGPNTRMEPLEEKLDLIERTLEAAHAISAKLGYLPPGNQKQI
jgi:DNA-binding IclR family transcriptional regulator